MLKDEERYKTFNEMLNSIPFDEMHHRDAEEKAKNKADFEKMKECLKVGKCSLCGELITHFSTQKPCPHWLLKPKGFKKKHFPLLYADKGFHQLEAYLRWVANTETFATNINDLVAEASSSKVIEETIRFRNLEWSFSCSKGCFEGLPHSHSGKFPHYHFQMKVDGLVVINYNGFHIPFNDYDEFSFAAKAGKFDRLSVGQVHGVGMQDMMDILDHDVALDFIKRADDESKAHYKVQSFIMADEGTTISGDDIADMMEESERTKVPMWQLMKRLKNVTIRTVIEPGPGIPNIAVRKANRGGGSNSSGE